ncbi:hypothetical protein [Mucilaginibacter phyllosphaerae]|uniref:Uncharacterized protein n=1 Tax=Mucilaginibacter phyllosphaerae TaxID=1812349 RepID=A0A4Y8ABN1_9SPHI|nr:hypothetical protein [Mucilaginibacter phyllosphaerae]MBB3969235.1 hypothetical protein [Mucilaginibacter phyllosphaerae]TEW65964.1 hypothetical protein E2R65_12605 [Mucilaginibacter phyllosphaerae]GGH07156.1 hypothetical protein GCM10007352_11740 [Mucilaginibacter phyllosphaerae]
MSDYKQLDQLRAHQLTIVKKGFWYPDFELTDGQYVYGRLSYSSNFNRNAIIETPQGTWTIKRKGWFKRALLLNKGENENIGTLTPQTWKRDFNLYMDSGFEATYLYKKMFSKSLTITNDSLGDMLEISLQAFNFKQPYAVTFCQVLKQDQVPSLPLITLIGLHIILLRRQQAAAS